MAFQVAENVRGNEKLEKTLFALPYGAREKPESWCTPGDLKEFRRLVKQDAKATLNFTSVSLYFARIILKLKSALSVARLKELKSKAHKAWSDARDMAASPQGRIEPHQLRTMTHKEVLDYIKGVRPDSQIRAVVITSHTNDFRVLQRLIHDNRAMLNAPGDTKITIHAKVDLGPMDHRTLIRWKWLIKQPTLFCDLRAENQRRTLVRHQYLLVIGNNPPPNPDPSILARRPDTALAGKPPAKTAISTKQGRS